MLVASPCQYMKCLQGIHRCLEWARQISGKCGLFSATNFTRMHFDEGVLLCMHIWWFCMWIQTVTTSIAVFKTSVEWKHCRCERVSLHTRVLFASKTRIRGFAALRLTLPLFQRLTAKLLSALTATLAVTPDLQVSSHVLKSVSGNSCDISGVTKSIVLIRKIMDVELGV